MSILNWQSISKMLIISILYLLTMKNVFAADNHFEKLEKTLNIQNIKRSYILLLPKDLTSRKEWPVLFALHPGLANSSFWYNRIKFQDNEFAKNFIIVYPDGYLRTYNVGGCCGPAGLKSIDDLAFFDKILEDLKRIAPIKEKVFLTGFSNGALLSYYLFCKRPDKIAAIAPFAATMKLKDCQQTEKVIPIFHFHGAEDKSAPAEGGYSSGEKVSNILGVMPSAEEMVYSIISKNGDCAVNKPQMQYDADLDTTCKIYTNCKEQRSKICIIQNLGHSWPGQSWNLPRFGKIRDDLNGAKAVLKFFNEVDALK